MYAFPFSLMYLLFCTDFYIFRNFVFFVFLVVQYRRSVISKIKRLDTNTRDFSYNFNLPGFNNDLLDTANSVHSVHSVQPVLLITGSNS